VGMRGNALFVVQRSEGQGQGVLRGSRDSFTYIGPPNGPIQRLEPVRYAQYGCYETTARSETRKLAPPLNPTSRRPGGGALTPTQQLRVRATGLGSSSISFASSTRCHARTI
jgi:hypothetical protein